MNTFTIKSYAKINLAINITGKSSNLHKIESLVSFIRLHDLIYVKKIYKKNHKIFFNGNFSKNISKINTITRLLKILDKKKFLANQKFEIKIIKNIPQKAGMGGGSMNAASLLNFFIKKKIIKIKKNEIEEVAKLIGSDVILGLNQTNTILYGNNKIKRYRKKQINLHTLAIKPNFGCSTKYIYSKVRKFTKPQFNYPRQTMFNKNYLKGLSNDFEKIVFDQYPKLKKIKLYLSSLPDTIFVRMSGSGSSIVAYFHSKRACSNAYKQFKGKFNSYWCIISKTI